MTGIRIGLLAGPVGVGKTTVAERVVGLAHRQGLACGGLLAPAMLNRCGRKVGIWGHDVGTAERRILARTDRDLAGLRVGPYSFDDAALAWAVGVIEGAIGRCDLLIVDEIGRLELEQGLGLAPILSRLTSGEAGRSLVLVRDSLVDLLKGRLEPVETVLFHIDEKNRRALAPQVLADLM